jgi:DNA-binding PadR family transcriptional regulator
MAASLFDDMPEVATADLVHSRRGQTRADDPATSHKAARDVEIRTGTQRASILLALWGRPFPMTAHDIDAEIGWRLTTAGRRLPELAAWKPDPLVRTTGEERPTDTGSAAELYELTDAGRAEAGRLEDQGGA